VTRTPLPSQVDAEQLGELLEDVRAIPAEAFEAATDAASEPLAGAAPPAAVVEIPESTLALAAAAGDHLPDYSANCQ